MTSAMEAKVWRVPDVSKPLSSSAQLDAPSSLREARTAPRWWVERISSSSVEIGLIVIGLVVNLTLAPHNLGGDGRVRFHALSLLLQQGTLDNSKYSLIGPLFSAPFWFLGTIWQNSVWWASRFNVFVFAIGLLAMYWLLRDRIDRKLLHAFLLLLVAASIFPNQLEYYYGEVFTAVFVAVGTLAIVFGPTLLGWIAVIVGVANTPATLAGMCLMVLLRILQRGRVRSVLALIAALGLVGLENTIRRGSPLNGGYEAGFNNPIFFGLLGILFSYGKGLIFFTPGLFLPVRRRLLAQIGTAGRQLYTVYTLWIAFVIALVLLYSHWWAWFGGNFWGPRFFLFASLPASLVLAVRLRYPGNHLAGNLLTLVALALSSWVAITGMVFDRAGTDACLNGYVNMIGLCAYTPQYSGLWRALATPLLFTKRDMAMTGYCAVVFLYLAWPLLRTMASQAHALWQDMTNAEGVRWLWRLRF
jgi:hypothetical protein